MRKSIDLGTMTLDSDSEEERAPLTSGSRSGGGSGGSGGRKSDTCVRNGKGKGKVVEQNYGDFVDLTLDSANNTSRLSSMRGSPGVLVKSEAVPSVVPSTAGGSCQILTPDQAPVLVAPPVKNENLSPVPGIPSAALTQQQEIPSPPESQSRNEASDGRIKEEVVEEAGGLGQGSEVGASGDVDRDVEMASPDDDSNAAPDNVNSVPTPAKTPVPDSEQNIKVFLERREDILANQRKMGISYLQRPTEISIRTKFAALESENTRITRLKHLDDYLTFCQQESAPGFPMLPEMVALYLHDNEYVGIGPANSIPDEYNTLEESEIISDLVNVLDAKRWADPEQKARRPDANNSDFDLGSSTSSGDEESLTDEEGTEEEASSTGVEGPSSLVIHPRFAPLLDRRQEVLQAQRIRGTDWRPTWGNTIRHADAPAASASKAHATPLSDDESDEEASLLITARCRGQTSTQLLNSQRNDADEETDDCLVKMPHANDSFVSDSAFVSACYNAARATMGFGTHQSGASDRTCTVRCNSKKNDKDLRCRFTLRAVLSNTTGRWVVDGGSSHPRHNHGRHPEIIKNPDWRPRRGPSLTSYQPSDPPLMIIILLHQAHPTPSDDDNTDEEESSVDAARRGKRKASRSPEEEDRREVRRRNRRSIMDQEELARENAKSFAEEDDEDDEDEGTGQDDAEQDRSQPEPSAAGARAYATPTATPAPLPSTSILENKRAPLPPFVDSPLSPLELCALLTDLSILLAKPLLAESLYRDGIRSVKNFINFMFLPEDWIDKALIKCGPEFTKVVRVTLLRELKMKCLECGGR
ncbi:hypothetical protein P7C70_g7116, partial [Phenoliferia sp. Uapishka_3]